MKFITVTFAFILSFAMASVKVAYATQASSVAVEGVLQIGEFLGPPNYGENPGSDRIERSYYLQLPTSIATQVQNPSSVLSLNQESKTTYFVQLVVFEREQPVAKMLIGKKVKAVGLLFEAETGHHRTPVLMRVQSVLAIKEWGW